MKFKKYEKDRHIVIEFFSIKFKIKQTKNPMIYFSWKLLKLITIFSPIKLKEENLLTYYTFFKWKKLCKNVSNCYIKSETKFSKQIQDKYYKKSNKDNLVIFLIPQNISICCGGIMSMFSIINASKILTDMEVLAVTLPGKYTYFRNTFFKNETNIYRWEQIVNDLSSYKKIILHINEYAPQYFYEMLSKKDKDILKNLKNLQINILNQRNDVCATPQVVGQTLRKITDNITMTTAHSNYCTQEMANKYNMPLHLFSVNLDLSPYKPVNWEQKEKLIILSPDETKTKFREKIQKIIKKELPDYKYEVIYNMPFTQYMNLTAKSLISISTGEGFDGYIVHPLFVERIGMAVYNDEYFPDKTWKEDRNIYNTEDELLENLVKDIRYWETHKEEYYSLCEKQLNKIKNIYNYDEYLDNIQRYYEEKYDYIPNLGGNK